MKICLVTLRHEFRNSGEIESIVNLQEYLKRNGVSADILTPDGLYSALMPASKSGLSLGKVADLWRLYGVLKKHHINYDLVHLFLPFPAFSFFGDLIKYSVGAKLVVTFESCMANADGAGLVRLFQYEPFSNLLRLCINNRLLAMLSTYAADAYIVSSMYQKKQLALRRAHVMPNLTNTSKFNKVAKCAARKRIGLPETAHVISYIGHLLEIKGLMDLLRAFSILSRDDDSMILAIAFSGIGRIDKIKKWVRRLNIEEKVLFWGTVNVSDFISASDLMVVPYRYSFGTNWFPSILLEGFSVGIPIVTTDLPALHELNQYGEVLSFVAAANPGQIAATARQLLENGRRAELIVRNQRDLIYTILNPEVLIVKYISIYKMVLNEEN